MRAFPSAGALWLQSAPTVLPPPHILAGLETEFFPLTWGPEALFSLRSPTSVMCSVLFSEKPSRSCQRVGSFCGTECRRTQARGSESAGTARPGSLIRRLWVSRGWRGPRLPPEEQHGDLTSRWVTRRCDGSSVEPCISCGSRRGRKGP